MAFKQDFFSSAFPFFTIHTQQRKKKKSKEKLGDF